MCAAVRGLDMFGLANEVVQFLLGQLPGIDSCRHYQRRHHDTSVRVPSPVPLPESFPVDTNFVVFIIISAFRSPGLLMYLLYVIASVCTVTAKNSVIWLPHLCIGTDWRVSAAFCQQTWQLLGTDAGRAVTMMSTALFLLSYFSFFLSFSTTIYFDFPCHACILHLGSEMDDTVITTYVYIHQKSYHSSYN